MDCRAIRCGKAFSFVAAIAAGVLLGAYALGLNAADLKPVGDATDPPSQGAYRPGSTAADAEPGTPTRAKRAAKDPADADNGPSPPERRPATPDWMNGGDSPAAPRRLESPATESPATEAKPADERPAAEPKTIEIKPTADPKSPKADALTPVPEAANAGPAEIEATSFHGVVPGVTTQAEVEKAWGPPKEVRKQDGVLVQLFSVTPFPRVEVAYGGEKVASIIIRFDKGFAAETVAQQLELAKLQPVFVSNELGEILGQSYPERGVLFSFEAAPEPGKVSMKVTHIILEPISAEPFLLRAETNLDTRCDFSLSDLDQALKLQPGNARAHWLRARVLAAMGSYEKGAAAAGEAVRLAPGDARYHATRAQLLGQIGQVAEGLTEAQKAVESAGQRPHVKARALCLLGDLTASGAKPDYRAALQFHTDAVKEADALAGNKHPAIRQAAKEVLVDAHLGAALDIAWGSWKEKDKAVEVWLGKAAGFADDLIKNEGGSEEVRLRVCLKALAACVGVRGSLDPTRWTNEALRTGQSLIAATPVAARKTRFQWELGMALYDSLQVCQMRGDQSAALKYGQQAVEYLEKTGRAGQSTSTSYLLGRLYFRLGAIYAIRDSNHRMAVTWFEKAQPLLESRGLQENVADLGRHGETYVSMGVSYWETGQREKAVTLTERGVNLMEQAVTQGLIEKSALAVPYANLASMHRQLGQTEKAQYYEGMAGRNRPSKVQ
jgi:tetratricopeptide (TPR) repeat protein